MKDKYQKIEITPELVSKIAIIQSNNYGGGCFKWDDLSDFGKRWWLNQTAESIEIFNNMVKILSRIELNE